MKHDSSKYPHMNEQTRNMALSVLKQMKDTASTGQILASPEVQTERKKICYTCEYYDVERQFKETHQDYKTDDDEIFIPYRTFKDSVAEALKEALDADRECPPCDTLSCADHLTDD